MEVQIFGVKKDSDTRAALRFFAERRIKTHFVDFTIRGPSPGELRRFAQKFGIETLLARDSPRFKALGWSSARYGEETWLERLSEEPLALRLPLVRCQQRLTVGLAPEIWKTWKEE
jgi:arsenate reductase-like glutaredoxin family protein